MMRLKVEGNEKLVRDPRTLAILNTDSSVVKLHNIKMRQLEKQKVHEEEINMLKNDILEIKSLLARLIKSN